MIFDILKDGLEYVGTNKNQTILYYIGILLLPIVLIESYSYHTIKNCLDGIINNKDELPSLTLNPENIINGLKLLILKTIYYLPEIIVLIITIYMGKINYLYLTIILIILSIISYALSQIASIIMVDTGKLGEGFNPTKIYNILKTVGTTYIELIIATFIIVMGIIGVTTLLTMIIMLLYGISNTLFVVSLIILAILYLIFLILVIPSYILFKNRTTVSVYNLKYE